MWAKYGNIIGISNNISGFFKRNLSTVIKKGVGERLRSLLDSRKISQRDFSDHVSVGPKQVGNWLSGYSELSATHIIEVARFFKGLDIRWLLTGEGKAFPGSDEDVVVMDNEVVYNEVCRQCIELRAQVALYREQCEVKDKAIAGLNRELGGYKGSNTLGFRKDDVGNSRKVVGGRKTSP